MEILVSRVQRRIEGGEWERLVNKLSAEMRADVERFRKWQDRHLALAGKLLIAKALELVGRDPEEIRLVKTNEFGRPFISGNFDFNLSHSGQIAVCAISSTCRLGVDVEIVRDVDISGFERYFSADEMESVKKAQDPLARFFRIWTMKESAIKADGRGLSIPLEEVRLMDGAARIHGKLWYITPVSVGEGHICHAAFDRHGEPVIVKQAQIF
ncbi:MAG: 4'-phosphopantetheinyl transferase superfamily protein [Nitrospinae bacterium]|nr:4'-phosphopantetheinyl transferase superfamily protein [Nitrospinota bacterium]